MSKKQWPKLSRSSRRPRIRQKLRKFSCRMKSMLKGRRKRLRLKMLLILRRSG